METSTHKKILFVITKSNWGGAQRYVYDLATNLPKEQFEVAVTLGGEDLLTQRLRTAHITVIPLASIQRDLSLARDTAGFSELYRTIKSFRPDIVHLNSSKAGGLGALAARSIGVPRIIFTAHGWPFAEKRNFFWRIFAFAGSWITAFLSHRVIVVSDHDLRVAHRMGFASKTTRIYNGIDLTMPFGSADIVRHSFPKGVRITGTVGELTKNKNHLSLIEQAKDDPDMYVAIVGDGEDRHYLTQKVIAYGLTQRVKIFGFHWASEVLKGFDVFALPSLKEGLPYVLIEARAAGLPIVANRVGGVGEILDAKDLTEFSLAQMVRKTRALYETELAASEFP